MSLISFDNLPLDNEDGLKVILRIERKGNGKEITHYMEDKHIQSEGELVKIATKAARILWETNEIRGI